MSLRLILAASAALAFAAPVLAQDAPAAPPTAEAGADAEARGNGPFVEVRPIRRAPEPGTGRPTDHPGSTDRPS